MSAGLARNHNSNPFAKLRVHAVYCVPVLFSGLASLVLSKEEVRIIDKHYQITLQNLLTLHQKTPRSVVYFLAGCLPGEALLNMRQLTLFRMICHLNGNPLNKHARHVLTNSPKSLKSWFQNIDSLCQRYGLPPPLQLLDNPPRKSQFKALLAKKVSCYWTDILTAEASELKSLKYFNPSQFSLTQPSQLWTTCLGSAYEIVKSKVVSKMISGRYRSDDLCKHWSPSNKQGHCLAPQCQGADVVGDLEHILVECPALQDTRDRLKKLWLDRSMQSPAFYLMIRMVLSSPPSVQVQFILDPTVFDGITMLTEIYGYPFLTHVHSLTRTKVPNVYIIQPNQDSVSGLAINTNNSVLSRLPASQCTSVTATTSPIITNTMTMTMTTMTMTMPRTMTMTMTGIIPDDIAVNTLGSTSVLARPVLPAQSALHSLVRPSIVSSAVQNVVTDTAACYVSTLQANTYSTAVTGSCARPVMSVSGYCSSVLSQSKP